MQIESPYHNRSKVAKNIFWLMLILLVNGWVDYANASLRNTRITPAGQAYFLQDDFDTFYEWIAESFFDIEDAVPEQKGDSDDAGKINVAKIILVSERLNLQDFSIPESTQQYSFVYKLRLPPHINLSIWDPPPNV